MVEPSLKVTVPVGTPLPGAVGVWNIIIARTFFQLTIPDQLREAAFIDGASNFRFFNFSPFSLRLGVLATLH